MLDKFQKEIVINLKGFEKHAAMKLYIDSMYNSEKYMNNDSFAYIRATKQTNDYLFQDIMMFCLDNDVFNKTGISILDIMEMEYYPYTVLRDRIKYINSIKDTKTSKEITDFNKQLKEFENKYGKSFNFSNG